MDAILRSQENTGIAIKLFIRTYTRTCAVYIAEEKMSSHYLKGLSLSLHVHPSPRNTHGSTESLVTHRVQRRHLLTQPLTVLAMMLAVQCKESLENGR